MQIHPFLAIRTPAHRASEVSCPPYDVVDRSEAGALARKENSFMRIIRPEVDFPIEQDPHESKVYERAKENLSRLLNRGVMKRESAPCMYVYRQARQGRRQAGLVCCVDVDDYRRGNIRRHELTRPDKELDRMQHMMEVGAHCEPVLLAVLGQAELVRQLIRDMNYRPAMHFTARDGVTHTLWPVQEVDRYLRIFSEVDRMYIADGHHRCAAASRVAHALQDSPTKTESDEIQRFPAVIYPAEELVILPYHRLARFGSGKTASAVAQMLAAVGSIEHIPETEDPSPSNRGEIGIFFDQRWWRFRFPPVEGASALDRLDVVRLSRTILDPILGIADERTDPNVSFLGGRTIEELASSVLSGRFDIAFAMYPTSIEELIEVAQANLIMPPKSTWFDPKIRSGLFVHTNTSQYNQELPSQP